MNLDSRRQYWQQHVDTWKISDLSQRAYAQAQGMSAKQLSYWVRQFKPKSPAPSVSFTSAHIQGMETGMSLSSPKGWTLHLPVTVPAAWVASLMSNLG